jgi:hypothetical protein
LVVLTVTANWVFDVPSVPLTGLTCSHEGLLDAVAVKVAVPELSAALKLCPVGVLEPI